MLPILSRALRLRGLLLAAGAVLMGSASGALAQGQFETPGEYVVTVVVLDTGDTNVTVERGIFDVVNCIGVEVDLDDVTRVSATITVRRDGTCSDPEVTDAQPSEFAVYVLGMDLTFLAYVVPEAGEPEAQALLFGNVPDVVNYLQALPLENANNVVSNILLP